MLVSVLNVNTNPSKIIILKKNIFLFGFDIRFKTVASYNDDMELYIVLLTSGACISSGVVNFKSQPLTCGIRWDERGTVRQVAIKANFHAKKKRADRDASHS